MRVRRRRREVAVLATVFIAAALTPVVAGSIVQAADVDEATDFTDRSGVQREYDAVVASFPLLLPAGDEFPVDAPYIFPAEPALFERGAGESAAYFYWQCSWMNVALSNADALDDALTQLSKWDQTPFYKDHIVVDASDPTWEEAIVEPAEEGDLDRLQRFHTEVCTGPLTDAGDVQ